MKREFRFTGALRAGAGDEPVLFGYAATFDSPSRPVNGMFVEKIQRGAFSRALREGQDIRALLNHDPSQILGRTKNGTLKLAEDDRGLRFDVKLDTANPAHAAAYAAIKRGDIDECSFGFVVNGAAGERWEPGYPYPIRTLLDVDLLDVSAVTYPQYNSTSVSARELFPDGCEELRSRIANLGTRTDADRKADLARLTAQMDAERLQAATKIADVILRDEQRDHDEGDEPEDVLEDSHDTLMGDDDPLDAFRNMPSVEPIGATREHVYVLDQDQVCRYDYLRMSDGACAIKWGSRTVLTAEEVSGVRSRFGEEQFYSAYKARELRRARVAVRGF